MAKRRTIRTLRELIEVYNGPDRLGKELKIGGTAITNWCSRGELPPGWGLGFYLGLTQAGYDISPRVFGAKKWAAIAIRPPKPRPAKSLGRTVK